MPDTIRPVSRVIRGLPTSDGAGVELTRVIGIPELPMLDPFLMLDVFRSDDPDDYIAGFPAHPHRGFETVTYLLDGRMRHRDNTGREGVIGPGGIQWMTAGRGIVHSEMPEQENGLLAGFQLWVNLPASHKMTDPAYQEHDASAIPVERLPDGTEVRVVVGRTARGTPGPVSQPLTEPTYLDVKVPAGVQWSEPVADGHNAFVFLFEGSASLPGLDGAEVELPADHLAVLARGDHVRVRAGESGARFLLVAGRPINEPVARGGPFVMNTQAEVRQAFEDYSSGRF
jgi:redox-sensitive bicupin YhaK (pirin superfamily)